MDPVRFNVVQCNLVRCPDIVRCIGLILISLGLQVCHLQTAQAQRRALVFQSDFGVKDAAVGAMKGVAFGVSSDLAIFDLTHEIPPFNIWEASYRLSQAVSYWPVGTVFVSVIDPGVGSDRRSVVARTGSGHFIVTPDNGTLTHIAEQLGIEEVREIDEAKNRLSNSGMSYTFHGRDVYAYTGARLASGVITFEEVGPVLRNGVVKIAYEHPAFLNGQVTGGIPVLDIQYGNVWTNIDRETLMKLGVRVGQSLRVRIYRGEKLIFNDRLKLVETFAGVSEGETLGYFNSLLNFSLAINMGDFAERYHVGSGSEWKVVVTKP